MKKRILAYRNRIDELLKSENENINWNDVLTEHLTQVSFFQHERLIHLIVTVIFALLAVAVFLVESITCYTPLYVLLFLLMILLVPYIKHYYLLENEVQKMYVQYDEILKRL